MNDHKPENPEPSLDLDFLVKTYNTRLMRVIQPFIRNQADLEDILQDTWTRAYLGLKGFRGGSQIFTWLYRIAVNSAISHVRKKQPDQLNEDRADPKRMFSPEEEFDKKQLRKEILSAVQKLSKNQKEVFLLRTFDEMPYEEISRTLGMTMTNAKTTYFYAVNRMRKFLKTAGFGIEGLT
jgi:RNA polymerase sigma factor (sigma-70 family)